jgi:hypothetical protein
MDERTRIRPAVAAAALTIRTSSWTTAIFGEAMARKPNYRYERAERERLKAERQAVRDQRKAQDRGDGASVSGQQGQEPAGPAANPGDDLSGRRDG